MQGYKVENINKMDSEDGWWLGSDDHRRINFVVQHMTELHQSELLLESTRFLDASVDDLFRVILLENPSTGYKWLINHKQDIENRAVEVVYDRFKAPLGTTPGVPGARYLTLKVVDESPYVMHFTYGRPWEEFNEHGWQFKLVFNKKV